MQAFLDKNNIISGSQFGFTKGKGTSHACYELLSNIQPIFTKKKMGICIFIDFSKAFYTVDADVLIIKLLNNGIRGPPFNY